jgi:hypothetical protein
LYKDILYVRTRFQRAREIPLDVLKFKKCIRSGVNETSVVLSRAYGMGYPRE